MIVKIAGTLAAGGLLLLLMMGASGLSPGRYQIVARNEGVSPGAGGSVGPAVYRVDTSTGQVCMFAFEGQWLEMGCVGK